MVGHQDECSIVGQGFRGQISGAVNMEVSYNGISIPDRQDKRIVIYSGVVGGRYNLSLLAGFSLMLQEGIMNPRSNGVSSQSGSAMNPVATEGVFYLRQPCGFRSSLPDSNHALCHCSSVRLPATI